MGRLTETLGSYRLVGLDTAPFIYLFEKNATYFPLVAELFDRFDANAGFTGITSVVTLIEVSVKPLRDGKPELVQIYEAALLNSPTVRTAVIDPPIAKLAAKLRATYNIKVPDALQVAACLEAGAPVFITGDAKLKALSRDITVLALAEFLTPA